MKNKITNQDRFDKLRGYYQDEKLHPKGGPGIAMNDLLHQMEFEGIEDFSAWYKSLSQDDIERGKEKWCSGKCCQSNLTRLLKESSKKLAKKGEEE